MSLPNINPSNEVVGQGITVSVPTVAPNSIAPDKIVITGATNALQQSEEINNYNVRSCMWIKGGIIQ